MYSQDPPTMPPGMYDVPATKPAPYQFRYFDVSAIDDTSSFITHVSNAD